MKNRAKPGGRTNKNGNRRSPGAKKFKKKFKKYKKNSVLVARNLRNIRKIVF